MPRRRQVLAAVSGGAATVLTGCSGDQTEDGDVTTVDDDDELTLSSPAFEPGGTIPETYTADGDDVSPPLSIEGTPSEAAGLVLVLDDPDAPDQPFTHWLLWNVPPGTTTIPENVRRSNRLDSFDGARQGTNDFGDLGYRGPSPPRDDPPHTYRFTLYATADQLNVQGGANWGRVEEGLSDNVVANTRLTAEYGR
jgi:Raf kinase inhibitor-like YbhB/YbcL family protein